MKTAVRPLNPEQDEAANILDGPLLILAGAGTGKTTVLTHRVRNILVDKAVDPQRILCITFTKKAAKEMRRRLDDMMPDGYTKGLVVRTIHGMCFKILARYPKKVGYAPRFGIVEEKDRKKLYKDTVKRLGLDAFIEPTRIHELVVDWKLKGYDLERMHEEMKWDEWHIPEDCSEDEFNYMLAVWQAVDVQLHKLNLMDYNDLLVYTLKLLKNDGRVATKISRNFEYICVDEYQDTSTVQFEIIEILSRYHRNLMVVGDDDQTIYTWRGADIRNILDFQKTFPDVRTVKLEQNYRSTSNILSAANAVIAENAERTGKTLWTEKGAGEKIHARDPFGDGACAMGIVGQCEALRRDGRTDIAVLYRMNRQSRVLEDTFRKAGVPHHVVGGFAYYRREEVMDCTAYLRLADNHADDVSLLRIVNKPKRGIGNMTLDAIRAFADDRGYSIFDAMASMGTDDLPPKSLERVRDFVRLFDVDFEHGDFAQTAWDFVESTEIGTHSYKREEEDSNQHLENIEEYRSVLSDFAEECDVERIDDGSRLAEFLFWISEKADDGEQLGDGEQPVQLMTVHKAKGLEFDTVFIVGANEGIFPLSRGTDEEERRLFYVAMTRAKNDLWIYWNGSRDGSQFIEAIPEETIEYGGGGTDAACSVDDPATEKQLGFMCAIARRLRIDMPVGIGKVAASQWIGAHADEFYGR